METRARGRQQAAQDNSGTRTTRQNAAQTIADRHDARLGALSSDPVARRGAPKPHRADSVASIATFPTNADGESEGEGDPAEPDSLSQEDVAFEDHEERYQIMTSLLPDLKRATDELYLRLTNGQHGSRVFAAVLTMKRNTFRTLLEAYSDPDSQFLFIDFTWAEELQHRTGIDMDISGALLRANIVLALDQIQQNQDEAGVSSVDLLEQLDASFPRFFADPQSDNRRFPKLALALRACYLIELLDGKRGKVNSKQVKAVIASVFCGVEDSADYATLFVYGPFRRLGGHQNSDGEIDMISNVIRDFLSYAQADKKSNGVEKMRKDYPLSRLFNQLQEWLQTTYHHHKDAERTGYLVSNDEAESGGNEFHDAPETITMSPPDSQVESQPIVRPREVQASLFKGADSLKHLDSSAVSRFRVPPSNQHTHGKAPSIAPSNAPIDYPEDQTSMLLTSQVTPRRHVEQRAGGRKRRHVDMDDDDDDDEDPFQTDTRPVNESRSRELQAKRQRRGLTNNRPPPSSSMRPPPATVSPRASPYSPLPQVSSTQADFLENVKLRKAETVARAKAMQASSLLSSQAPSSAYPTILPSPVKQRVAWSNRDAETLIRLVMETRAAWSCIEKEHSNEFEHPRNQQAYRDKARNMKVDFLITDALLPPCFDQVVLGKKEVARLLSLGKNPYRRESDRDELDRAIRTEI